VGPADIAIYRQARRHLPMAGIEPTVPAASPWQTFVGPVDTAFYRQARRHLPMAGIEPTVPAASPWQTFVGPVDTAIYRQARIHLSMAGIEPTGCSGHLALPLPFVTLFKQRESNVTDIMTRTRRLY